MKEQKIKICPVCGKVFQDSHRKCCGPECAKERNKSRQRELAAERKQEKKREELKKTSLARTAQEARRMGISYGQYVAMCYSRGQTVV